MKQNAHQDANTVIGTGLALTGKTPFFNNQTDAGPLRTHIKTHAPFLLVPLMGKAPAATGLNHTEEPRLLDNDLSILPDSINLASSLSKKSPAQINHWELAW